MSNTYFQFSKTHKEKGTISGLRETKMELDLTAYTGEGGNNVQLTLTNSGVDFHCVAVLTLTVQEQDDLIAGILERRNRITSTGCEKSEIHPPRD